MKNLGIVIVLVATASAGCGKGKHGRLERSEQLVCDSNNSGTVLPSKVVLSAEQAKSWGSAFEASGNCNATVSNPEFRSPQVALTAGGNAHLIIDGGILEGGTYAIVASGNAQVEIRGTLLMGEVKTSGNAKIIGMDTAKYMGETPPAVKKK